MASFAECIGDASKSVRLGAVAGESMLPHMLNSFPKFRNGFGEICISIFDPKAVAQVSLDTVV